MNKIEKKLRETFPGYKIEYISNGQYTRDVIVDGKHLKLRWTSELEDTLEKNHGIKLEEELLSGIIHDIRQQILENKNV